MSATNEDGELDPIEPQCRLDAILGQLEKLPGVSEPEVNAIAAAVGFLSSHSEDVLRRATLGMMKKPDVDMIVADAEACRKMLETLS